MKIDEAHRKVLRVNCFKALRCLYIATEKSVAMDVNAKVLAYISALEKLKDARK